MQMGPQAGRVNYEPSSLQAGTPKESPSSGFHSVAATLDGVKGRIRPESFADHYSQARMFYRSLGSFEQAHVASALVFELSKVGHVHVREAVAAQLRNIDESLAQRVAAGLGLQRLPEPPAALAPVRDLPLSPALRCIGRMKESLAGRSIAVLVSDGSDRASLLTLRAELAKEGATLVVVGPRVGGVQLDDGSTLSCDGQIAGTPSTFFDAIVVLLSPAGAAQLGADSTAVDFVRDAFAHLKAIAFDQGGGELLDKAGVARGPGVLGLADMGAFLAAAKTRQWGREAALRMLA